MRKILIIDDEQDMAENCARLLHPLQVQSTILTDGLLALERLQREHFDIILTDLRMPQCSGMEIVKLVSKQVAKTWVIMITGYGSIDVAVEAIRNGAYDFLTKPFSGDYLRICVKRALGEIALSEENENLKKQIQASESAHQLMGKSSAFLKAYAMMRKVAPTDVSVLILGESGTGKELFARSIHENSPRRTQPFVSIDCTSLPENLLESELFGYEKGAFTGANQAKQGLIETAQGGTLFLDEIGDLGLSLQAKLLRVLQEHNVRHIGGKEWISVDLRVVAATNVDLKQAITEKKFREDLYYRLNVVQLTLPPLRERQEDILFLAYEFLKQSALRFGLDVEDITPKGRQLLQDYSWPGNIRQLKNAVERAVVLCESNFLLPQDFPPEIRITNSSNATMKENETTGNDSPNSEQFSHEDELYVSLEGTYNEAKKRWLCYFQEKYLKRLLEKTSHNISKAAEAAGIDRRTIHRWLNDHVK